MHNRENDEFVRTCPVWRSLLPPPDPKSYPKVGGPSKFFGGVRTEGSKTVNSLQGCRISAFPATAANGSKKSSRQQLFAETNDVSVVFIYTRADK